MRFRTFVLALCVALSIVAVQARADFSAMYIFGDSLSDTGNLASAPGQGDFPPPFFENRVSNGPVAVETLAASLGLEANASFHLLGGPAVGTNYAVAGARASGSEAIDLTTQVGAFLQNLGAAPADALYVVFIGGNDVRDARDVDDLAAQDIISQAVAAIATNIETLATAGATIFLVTNAPDLGVIPETQLLAGINAQPLLPEIATQRTQAFNEALAAEVVRLRDELGLTIALVNLFNANRSVLDNALAYGLTNVDDACLLIVNDAFVFHPDCDNGANLNAFAFFDAIHPTAPVHERMGRVLFAFTPAPPPDPPLPPVVE